MRPPSSRYRVVERGGRLVVIDAATGGAPPTARELLPVAGDPARQCPRESGDPESQAAPLETLDPRLRGDTDGTDMSDVAGTTTAGMARSMVERPSFTTARWYDAKAPRTLRLKPEASNQAGCVLLIGALVALTAIVLALSGDVLGWGLLFILFVVARQAKPLVTAWLDRQAIA